MLKRRWDRFMCPNGIRRTFNPRKWEHGTLVLVFGELLALGAAIAAIPGWTHGKWFLYAAPIIAAGALAWYALDKSSLGEMPLTGVSANRIANVVLMVNATKRMGPIIQWHTITADGTHARVDLTKLNPRIKTQLAPMARKLLQEIDTPEASGIRDALGTPVSEADDDTILDAIIATPLQIVVSEDDENEPQA